MEFMSKQSNWNPATSNYPNATGRYGADEIRAHNDEMFELDCQNTNYEEKRERYKNRRALRCKGDFKTLRLLKELDEIERMEKERENW